MNKVCFAQSVLSLEQKRSMVSQSTSTVLADSFINNVKDFAVANDVDFEILSKNLIHFKVIFNEEIDVTKRIQYCDYLLELLTYDKYLLPSEAIVFKKNSLMNSKLNSDE